MAKFNKDEFKSKIEDSVKNAILKGLITRDDIENKDQERLDGFIRFQLAQSIEDRKWCVDVLKDFNYDEKISWSKLESIYGKFKSLTDVALVNLWKFVEKEKISDYDTYQDEIDTVLSQPADNDSLLDVTDSSREITYKDEDEDEITIPKFKSRMHDIDAEDLEDYEDSKDEAFSPQNRRFVR